MKLKPTTIICLVFMTLLFLSGCAGSDLQKNDQEIHETIPGWKYYEIENISFYLPKSYIDITDEMRQTYPIESKGLLFMAGKPYDISDLNESSISILINELSEATTLDRIMYSFLDSLPDYYEFISSEEIPSSGYPKGKVVVSVSNPDVGYLTQEVYFFFVGNNLYQVLITNISETYTENQIEFVQIIDQMNFSREDYSDTFIDNYQGVICLGVVFLIVILILLNAWLKRRRRTDDITPLIIPEDF